MLSIAIKDILIFISNKLKVIKFMKYFSYKYLTDSPLDFNAKLTLLNPPPLSRVPAPVKFHYSLTLMAGGLLFMGNLVPEPSYRDFGL